MTTKVRRIVSPSLYEPNESLNLSRDRARYLAGENMPLAAITYVCSRGDADGNWEPVIDTCGQQVAAKLYERSLCDKVVLFVADSVWLPRSPTIVRKRLWGRRGAEFSKRGMLLGLETEFIKEGRVRYAGIVWTGQDGFASAVDIARKDMACALVAGRAERWLDESAWVENAFHAAFPMNEKANASRIDWLSLIVHLCKWGDVVVRVSGLFDDPELALDCIVRPDIINIDAL
jgi:hypothetical protein